MTELEILAGFHILNLLTVDIGLVKIQKFPKSGWAGEPPFVPICIFLDIFFWFFRADTLYCLNRNKSPQLVDTQKIMW